jgi:phytoene dehydrogenase-like protein
MRHRVAIIGAGLGGLTAAIRLARHGFQVSVYEARSEPGGLASSRVLDGHEFDGGPYVLLDRPGLEWAFGELNISLDDAAPMHRIGEVYEVESDNHPPVRVSDSLEGTAGELDSAWPGAGRAYIRFVESAWSAYKRLQPLQKKSRVGFWDLIHGGVWRDVNTFFQSLGSFLQRSTLPLPVRNAIGIWAHVAGHRMESAPAPLAFVPALIHHIGAWYPIRGLADVPRALVITAERAGVEFHFGGKVKAIRCVHCRAQGIELESGDVIETDAVLANAHGIGAYLQLLQDANGGLPSPTHRKLSALPLQSPGVCAYLTVKTVAEGPYLRFLLPSNGELCRLLITPSNLPIGPDEHQQWQLARLMAPMDHGHAESGGRSGQQEYLDRILDEGWWKRHIGEYRVLGTRLPCDWGEEFHLYRNSMNPVMTPELMRAGRLRHRSPYIERLYLAGSATHPGQWVSFCAISGIFAADCLREDFS